MSERERREPGKGRMDHPAQVVTSPDRALYSREQKEMHVRILCLRSDSLQETQSKATHFWLSVWPFAHCFLLLLFFLNDSLVFHCLLSVYTCPDE